MNVVCVLKFFDGTLLPVLRIVRKESVYPPIVRSTRGAGSRQLGPDTFFPLNAMEQNAMEQTKTPQERMLCLSRLV